MIFVGFSDTSSAGSVDPIERKYVSGAEHVNFYEDGTARQCSLRNLTVEERSRRTEQQPLIVDDNEI